MIMNVMRFPACMRNNLVVKIIHSVFIMFILLQINNLTFNGI